MDWRSKLVARIADLVIDLVASFNLEARQHLHDLAIRLDHLGSNLVAGAVLRQKLIQRGVAQVFSRYAPWLQVLGVDFRHRKSVAAEALAKTRGTRRSLRARHTECRSPCSVVGQPNNVSSRPAEMSLQRLHPRRRSVEMLLEELL